MAFQSSTGTAFTTLLSGFVQPDVGKGVAVTVAVPWTSCGSMIAIPGAGLYNIAQDLGSGQMVFVNLGAPGAAAPGSNIASGAAIGAGFAAVLGAAAGSGSGMVNPMTTAGDLITGGTSGMAGRLGIGTAGQVLTVSSGAPAWATPVAASSPVRLINTQAGTTYTTVLADGNSTTAPGSIIQANNAAAITVTIPTNASVAYPIGSELYLTQAGAGQVTLAPAAGVTLNNASTLKTRVQNSTIGLYQSATDVWTVFGDVA